MLGDGNCQLIDIAIPKDHNIVSKKNEKVSTYIDLPSVIRAKHKVKTKIVPFAIGTLGSISKRRKHTLMLLVSQT